MTKHFFKSQPEDLIHLLLSYLHPKDISSLAAVDSYFRQLMFKKVVWKQLIEKYFPELLEVLDQEQNPDYQDAFIKEYLFYLKKFREFSMNYPLNKFTMKLVLEILEGKVEFIEKIEHPDARRFFLALAVGKGNLSLGKRMMHDEGLRKLALEITGRRGRAEYVQKLLAEFSSQTNRFQRNELAAFIGAASANKTKVLATLWPNLLIQRATSSVANAYAAAKKHKQMEAVKWFEDTIGEAEMEETETKFNSENIVSFEIDANGDFEIGFANKFLAHVPKTQFHIKLPQEANYQYFTESDLTHHGAEKLPKAATVKPKL